jgi:hypothetical protein
MNVRWAQITPMWTFIALLLLGARVEAQVPPGALGAGPAYSPEAPMDPGFMPYGGPGYAGPGMEMPGYGGGPMMMGDPGMYGGFGDPNCPPEGYGFDGGPNRGFIHDFMGLIGPYADGGCAAPRYFDVSLEALWFRRDNAGRNVNLASDGIDGPVVLRTDQFSFDDRASFRFAAWLQFRSRANLEFVYFGLFHHDSFVQVNSPTDNLYSVMSEFGTNPPGGFAEESQAAYNRMEYFTNFDNFEINYRRHWQGPNARLQGSWLAGFRYFKLDEDFNYITVSTLNASQMLYNVNVNNSLVGGQVGGDLWVCIIPGMRAGVETKLGLFGNHSSQGSSIAATGLTVPYTEAVGADTAAFLGDTSFYLTYRISQQFNLKTGYNLLYASGLTLAPENFNPEPPFLTGDRVATINTNGAAFYHGFSVGVEYNW